MKAKAKKDATDIINEKILEKISAGELPWRKTWKGGYNLAINRKSKRPYALINQIMLGLPGEWAPLKYWNEIGGKVKKGEHQSIIVEYMECHGTKKVTNENGEEVEEKFIYRKPKFVGRYFHISQIEGVEPLNKSEIDMSSAEHKLAIEDVLQNYYNAEGIHVYDNDMAFYRPFDDTIHRPKKIQFDEIEEYIATLVHETAHSTGSKKRLNRTFGDRFGDEKYSKEELVAEISTVYLMGLFGISTEKCFDNSAAYIQGWLKPLQDDKKMFLSAASDAKKVMDYIMKYDKIEVNI